ncbi:MAG: Hsp20/alpha crystallin family protein [Candidatus Aenigmarchaeota archaeon]|nr:Hsp20/alpha crystallin family protein [Candidatus Aenigmarchaeota archaeon]
MWRDPFEEIKRFQREMNRFFNTFWESSEFNRYLSEKRDDFHFFREPLSDLRETEKELIASIEIPGVEKDDIQLSVTENTLSVKVEKKAEAKIQKENYLRAERSYKGFYRSIDLPCKIIPDKVKASYKNGILEIVMPKAEKKKMKKIKIE